MQDIEYQEISEKTSGQWQHQSESGLSEATENVQWTTNNKQEETQEIRRTVDSTATSTILWGLVLGGRHGWPLYPTSS